MSSGNMSTETKAPTPTGLAVSANITAPGYLTIRWDNPGKDHTYTILRQKSGTSTWTELCSRTFASTEYSDGSLVSGTTYYYKMTITWNGVTSAYSSTASAAPL